jgi:hypothetical protein
VAQHLEGDEPAVVAPGARATIHEPSGRRRNDSTSNRLSTGGATEDRRHRKTLCGANDTPRRHLRGIVLGDRRSGSLDDVAQSAVPVDQARSRPPEERFGHEVHLIRARGRGRGATAPCGGPRPGGTDFERDAAPAHDDGVGSRRDDLVVRDGRGLHVPPGERIDAPGEHQQVRHPREAACTMTGFGHHSTSTVGGDPRRRRHRRLERGPRPPRRGGRRRTAPRCPHVACHVCERHGLGRDPRKSGPVTRLDDRLVSGHRQRCEDEVWLQPHDRLPRRSRDPARPWANARRGRFGQSEWSSTPTRVFAARARPRFPCSSTSG